MNALCFNLIVALGALISTSIAYPLNLNATSNANIKVNPLTHGFVDDLQRTRIFHGVNAVYKVAPWHPTVSGFNGNDSLVKT